MRKISYNFLFIIGLMLTFGMTSVFGFGDDKNKRPKNTGILTVKTAPVSYPVKIDGTYIGMSGTGTAAEFYLAPGVHKLEIEFPNGKIYTKDVEIFRDRKNCVCLKYIEETIKRPCPYDISVSAPENVLEGDLITFAAFNNVTGSTTPLNYRWMVSPDTVRITSGLGTSAITVDTTGMGGKTITADLDVTDDVYGKTCFQKNSVPTEVRSKPKIEAFRCDEFESITFDDDKARFDNCVIQLQGSPDAQFYIIIYQGTDKISMTRNTFDKLSKRTLDYLVKTRGVDPRRISIVKGPSNRLKTTYEIWFVPPGAPLPVPQ
jgi:hypothetical protein